MGSFEDVLESRCEEDVQRYLTSHPEILLAAFTSQYATSCDEMNVCIPKFKFGIEFISDFLILSCGSFSCEIVLIELEPPTERQFTKSGSYAKRLNGALQQIHDWIAWIKDNQEYFKNILIVALKKQSKLELSEVLAGTLRHRLLICGKIIIGQRATLNDQNDKRRAILYEQTSRSIEIVPYDRLVDIERRLPK